MANTFVTSDLHFGHKNILKYNPETRPWASVQEMNEAHAMCQDRVKTCMKRVDGPIAVCNTFTKVWEMKPYKDLADEYGYDVFCMVVENRHGNSDVHSVPAEVKQKQERNLRNSLKLS